MTTHARKVMSSHKRPDWPTPWGLYRQLDAEFHFDLDVCASPENAKAPNALMGILTEDGLASSWCGRRCFMNPPYGLVLRRWLEKAVHEALAGATVVALLPARTDTVWWHDWVLPFASEIRFLRGRLTFEGSTNPAPFPSVVVVFRPPARVMGETAAML